MNKRRLLKLAEFLETAELPGKFKMACIWADSAEDGRPSCGTAACAGGWATIVPSFRRAGLRMVPPLNYPRTPDGGGLDDFFGLDGSQHAEIFIPHDMEKLTGKRGRTTVAKRIRKLVESAP